MEALEARASKRGKETGGVVVFLARGDMDAVSGDWATGCNPFCSVMGEFCPATGDGIVSIHHNGQ